MEEICEQQGLSCVKCVVFDSTLLCNIDGGILISIVFCLYQFSGDSTILECS